MNILKIFALLVSTIVYFGVGILLIKLLLKKVSTKGEEEGNFKLSYTILLAGLLLALTIIFIKSTEPINYNIEYLLSNGGKMDVLGILKNMFLIIGIGLLSFILVFYTAKIFTMFIYKNRNELIEMENDNYTFFIINSVLLVCFSLLILPIIIDIISLLAKNVTVAILP